MKYAAFFMFVILVLFTSGCDTELGHNHECHDHGGDGIQGHAPEYHQHETHDEIGHDYENAG